MKPPANPPVIDTLAQAIAMGQALGDVMYYDRGWAGLSACFKVT